MACQLIFVEERDEGVRDDLVEALHEALDLESNGLCHPHLCHQLHILLLQDQHDNSRGII